MVETKCSSSIVNDYDSDEEPPTENLLVWRLDPVESMSDWKLEIVCEELPEEGWGLESSSSSSVVVVATYHVHKVVLATGPRKSEYFARLFHEGEFSETQTNTSRIKLHGLAAGVVPEVLDYIYDGHAALKISTETATALHSLGRYFEIRRLKWDVKQFFQKDLQSVNCGTYYEHAQLLLDEKIGQAAEKMCQENIMQIDTSSRLLHVPNTAFWINLLENATVTNSFSSHISTLIVELCSNVDIDLETFQKMTEDKFMPVVDFDSALALIELERNIVAPSSESLSSLQERCVHALADQWSDLNTSDPTISTVLVKQNPLLLTELLDQTLSGAQCEEANLEEANSKIQEELCEAQAEIKVLTSILSKFVPVDATEENDRGQESSGQLITDHLPSKPWPFLPSHLSSFSLANTPTVSFRRGDRPRDGADACEYLPVYYYDADK